MTVYHSSYCIVDKPDVLHCFLNQRLIDKYITFLGTEEL